MGGHGLDRIGGGGLRVECAACEIADLILASEAVPSVLIIDCVLASAV